MRKNVASQVVAGQVNSRVDGSPLTSAAVILVTGDGGAQGAGAGTLVHEGNGCWSYVPTQAETNFNHVAFTFGHATGVYNTVNVYPVAFDPYDVVDLGLTNLDAAITTRLAPTVSLRTLDVSVTGEAGLDWANIGAPATAQNLSATNIDVDQIIASVSGAVGSVVGLTPATVHSDLDDIQARLPAALVGGRMDSSVGAVAANAITAASIATDAIDADALAADAVAEIAAASSSSVWSTVLVGTLTAQNVMKVILASVRRLIRKVMSL
jgi:hypothetical protein